MKTENQMKTHLDITITAENANELDSFTPVSGAYSVGFLEPAESDLTIAMIEESIRNWLNSEHALKIEVFAANGHAVTDHVPSNGTWIATLI